jgi:periodic tryptophan protein 2
LSLFEQFSNLCGSLYKQGNLVFTPDGNSVLSPVGNRISVFDLVKFVHSMIVVHRTCLSNHLNTSFVARFSSHKSITLPFQNRKNISRLALSANGNTLLSIDEDGGCLLINLPKRVQLCHFNFKKPVRDARFSPDSKYIAVTFGRQLQVRCHFFSPLLFNRVHSQFIVLLTGLESASFDHTIFSIYFVANVHGSSR